MSTVNDDAGQMRALGVDAPRATPAHGLACFGFLPAIVLAFPLFLAPGGARASAPAARHAPPTEGGAMAPAHPDEPGIPSGSEDFLAAMLGRGETLPGRCVFAGGEAARTVIRARYECAAGRVLVALRHPSKARAAAILTDRFAISLSGARVPGLAAELESRVRAREGAFEWLEPRSYAGIFALPAKLLGIVMLGWTAVVVRRRMRGARFHWTLSFKFTHALPSLLQIVLFAYWSVYFTRVGDQLPVILLQLAFAYWLDALLSLTRTRTWHVGLGPVPIVLSSNLFIWFREETFLLGFAVIALALASKAFVRFRGRHVFNPSVFGITVVGLACVTFPDRFPYEDIAVPFNLAPNMAEVVFLLALIPQSRLRTAWVSLGAFCGAVYVNEYLWSEFHPLFQSVGITSIFIGPLWAPILLAFTLLAGDPATIPRSSVGRFAFGLIVGSATGITSGLLSRLVGPDYFSKIFPIAIANLSYWGAMALGARLAAARDRIVRMQTDPTSGPPGPTAERGAGRTPHLLRWRPFDHPLTQLACLVLWAWMVVTAMPGSKPNSFENTKWLHALQATWAIRFSPDGAVPLDENPAFVRAFSFLDEWNLWRPPPAASRGDAGHARRMTGPENQRADGVPPGGALRPARRTGTAA